VVSFSRTRLAACALTLVALLGSGRGVSGTQTEGPPRRVLFIGNSLTAAHNLPGVVETMAASIGWPLRCERVTFDGYSLEDHWNEGSARRAIAKGGWSTVVLQQGPSALPESRVLLIEYARRFDADARRAGARTALFMVWPASSRLADFDGVKTSYANAARAVDGLLLPAGDAWRQAWRLDARVALYGADGFHPAPSGSYLAALVILQHLSGQSVERAPTSITTPGPPALRMVIPDAEAVVLKRAAALTGS
jgi:hypothetical protein